MVPNEIWSELGCYKGYKGQGVNHYENFLQIFIVSLRSSVSLVLHGVFTVGLDFKAGSVSGFFIVSFTYLPINRSTQFTHAADAYADYRSNEHLSVLLLSLDRVK